VSRYRAAYWDPTGSRYGLPTYPWRMAPDGLATRRQLAAAGLRPGGQPIQAQILWHGIGGERVAYLYAIADAKPKRTPTPAQRAALGKALAARRCCPDCGRDAGYVIPARFGCCWPCAEAAGWAA
jgi:hypothetical protein